MCREVTKDVYKFKLFVDPMIPNVTYCRNVSLVSFFMGRCVVVCLVQNTVVIPVLSDLVTVESLRNSVIRVLFYRKRTYDRRC